MLKRPLLLMLGLLCAAAPVAGGVLFTLEDPRGDDHGNGLLEYPGRTDFAKGDLDLLSLVARGDRQGVWFEVTFANDIRIPERVAIDDLGTQLDQIARHGFYTFNIDIYIDTDRKPGSGAVAMMPGRHAEVDRDHAWEKAIVLTPRPHQARAELERMMARRFDEAQRADADPAALLPTRAELRREIGPQVDQRVFFPNQVRSRGRVVRFFVPSSFLGGQASADWSYVVVVSGADLVQSFDLTAAVGLADETAHSLMIVPISPGRWKDRFGGGRDGERIQPPLVDIVVPAGSSQESLLRNFSTADDLPARLPGVVPASQPR